MATIADYYDGFYGDGALNDTSFTLWDMNNERPMVEQHYNVTLEEWQWQMISNFSDRGRHCMLNFWLSPQPEEAHCNATWDTFLCWPATPANSTVKQPCPHTNDSADLESLAHRTCTEKGEWLFGSWTNYSVCLFFFFSNSSVSDPPKNMENDEVYWMMATVLKDIYFYGSILSCILLVITLVIFSCFKSLQCSRISIHKNLVVSYIIRSVVAIVYFEPFISNRKHSYREIDWLCKVLTSIQYYAMVANMMWMFVEGLFLHNRVAISVFNTEAPFRVFYTVGWGLPALIVLAWALCMHQYNHETCWTHHYTMHHMWIIIAPLLTAVVVNAVFLVNIIRILITKLRANNTVELDQVRKAVKATAILFPLLGMTHILFFLRPNNMGYAMEMVYRVTHAVFQSSQGVFVSVIYCFMNSEVRRAVCKKWQRYQSQRMGNPNNRYRRRSSAGRTSTSTFMLPGGDKDGGSPKNPWTTIV